jgi:hypothetical protein
MRTSGTKVNRGQLSRSQGSYGTMVGTLGLCGCCRLLLPQCLLLGAVHSVVLINALRLTVSLPSSCSKVLGGRWGRSRAYEGPLRLLSGDAVAALCCCTAMAILTLKRQLVGLAGGPFPDCHATEDAGSAVAVHRSRPERRPLPSLLTVKPFTATGGADRHIRRGGPSHGQAV